MPLYMDLHIVPGITAQGVAEAHVLDLKVQEEYQCSCMTYWIDEANNSAFCLIEAPSASAVKELHNRSHGLMPFNIIEVNKEAVSSFLGRLYDPHIQGVLQEELKVFNDPAYRCMVFIAITDPVLLKCRNFEKSKELLNNFFQIVKNYCFQSGGEMAQGISSATSLICFPYFENAFKCALEISNAFTLEEKEILGIRISVNGGLPVTSNHQLFGETIDLGELLLYFSRDHNIVLAASLKNKVLPNFKEQGSKVLSLNSAEEKQLKKFFDILKLYSQNEEFGVEDFCRLAGLSKSSLNRHSYALTAKSPNNLIKEFRLNNALRFLKQGETISNVAFNTGFRSPSYFSKCFREHFSLSPSTYVEQIRNLSV